MRERNSLLARLARSASRIARSSATFFDSRSSACFRTRADFLASSTNTATFVRRMSGMIGVNM